MKTIGIEGAAITDLSPLEGMDLECLRLENCPIEDYSIVRTFPSLKILSLNSVGLQDLELLKGMSLTTLCVRSNQISDLSPLHGMPLQWLDFWGNDVEDISALEGMPLTVLACGANEISDISVVSGLPLTRIEAQYNKIQDISPIKDLELEMLRITNNEITDISCLKGSRCMENFGRIAEETPWKLAYTYNHKKYTSKHLEIAEGNKIPMRQAKKAFPNSVLKMRFYDETYDEDYNQEFLKTNKTWLSTEPFVKSYEWIWALIIVALGAGMIVVIVKKRKK